MKNISMIFLLLLGPFTAQACSAPIEVDSAKALQDALATASPGQKISILPGTYRGAFIVKAPAGGSDEQPVIIEAVQGVGTVILDGTGHHMTLRFNGSHHVVVRDLVITGGGYHGVFFENGASHITLENNWVHDNTTIHPLNSHAEIKGSGGDDATRPGHITLRGNRIYHMTHPAGGNFQGIDCNRCDSFHIVDNHIFDIGQPTGRTHSYYDQGACIQMKTRSMDTVIEGNRIENCHIGIVSGGEGAESPEHIGGVIRHNLILGSANIGLVVANVDAGNVHHNTFFGNHRDVLLGSDRRHHRPRNDVEIAHNIFTMPPEELVYEGASIHDNLVINPNEAQALFVDADGGDFRLKNNTLGKGASNGAEGEVSLDATHNQKNLQEN
jgi:hypothetical protein